MSRDSTSTAMSESSVQEIAPTSEMNPRHWIDLTYRLTPSVSRVPMFPAPRIERLFSLPDDPLNVTEIQLVCQVGTHVDVPCHFIPDGAAVDQLPLDRFLGTAVTWRIDALAARAIEPADLDYLTPQVRPGERVMFDAGWAPYLRRRPTTTIRGCRSRPQPGLSTTA